MMKNFEWRSSALKVLAAGLIAGAVSCSEESEKPNEMPIALFTATPASGTVGDLITFADQSADPDGKLVKWNWKFGDGVSSAEQHPQHAYGDAGEYTVWLTVLDDRGDSTQYNTKISINSYNLKWKLNIESGSSISPSAPAVGDDGTLYLGSQDGKVYAVSTQGSVKWSFTTGKAVRSTPALGADGTVYIPSQDGKLYALTKEGNKKWEFAIGVSLLDASPTVAADGTIYLGADDNKLYAINPDGSKKWEFVAGGKIRSSVAIRPDNALVVTCNDKKVYVLNPDGTEKWQFSTTATINASPALGADGTVYVGDDGGKFFAINADGSQKWVFTTADNNPFIGGAVLGTDGVIYVGTKRGPTTAAAIFYAITPDGQEKWKHNFSRDSEVAPMLQSDVLGTPTVGKDGTVYITFNDGHLYAFRKDGSLKFQYKVAKDDPANKWDQAMWTSPALTDAGVLYFADYSGIIYALQASAEGLADSPWPTRGKNLKRTGR